MWNSVGSNSFSSNGEEYGWKMNFMKDEKSVPKNCDEFRNNEFESGPRMDAVVAL